MKAEDREKLVKGFLDQMEKGVAPWTAGWKAGKSGAARNALSGRKYRGGNTILTWVAMMLSGYAENRWMTWNQVKQFEGARVKDGEEKKYLWLYRPYTFPKKDPKTGKPLIGDDGKPEKGIGFTHFNVYNVEQVEGLPDDVRITPELVLPEVPEDFENDVAGKIVTDYLLQSGVKMSESNGVACYNMVSDSIKIPTKALYVARIEEAIAAGKERGTAYADGLSEYYGTIFHECIHSTGHESRLNRFEKAKMSFGSDNYAFEELVAELGSAFILSELGLPGHCQHVEYLAAWAKGIREKPEAFFKASSLAATAADLVTGDRFKEEEPQQSDDQGTDRKAA